MAKILPISEVKTRFLELVSNVAASRDEIVVTRNGKPAAVLASYEEYEGLKETLDVLSDENLMKQIRGAERHFKAGGKGLTFEDVFGESLPSKAKRRRSGA